MNKQFCLPAGQAGLIIALAIIILALIVVLVWPFNNSDVKNLSVKAGQEIGTPLFVEGEAKGTWFFEGDFPIKITDEQGNVLGSSYVKSEGDPAKNSGASWMTEDFVKFYGQITYSSKTGGNGFLVLQKDNPSGLPEYDKKIKIPVVLQKTGYTTVKVYFSNSQMNPNANPCDKVFSVDREIKKIQAIGSATLWQVLRGPTDEEKEQGFETNINFGVKLLSLNINKDGTATADFDEQLEAGVGGSCKVEAIRAQIIETLKQFPTIKEVVISINGNTQDILQP